MAETHLQLNHDGSTATRKTVLWPASKSEQQEILRNLFNQKGWSVLNITNESGSHWKIQVSCQEKELNVNLFISSIRDESRQPDEFKMQLGTTYPKGEEPGWINLVLGIYTISQEGYKDEYILSGYDYGRYDFSSNPSIRGTRTYGLQMAFLYGMHATEKSVLFRPEFLYYYIEYQRNQKRNLVANNTNNRLQKAGSTVLNSYLSALRTKPFMLLAGISGTGKSRIVRKLAQATVTKELQQKYNENFTSENFDEEKWELHRPENFELIQVKPNWHNSMDVVGYLSNIPSPHYEFTPFVKFIVKAWCNPTIPFFLCLDEMNLAPVEEYFAEFLSAIESRGFENGEFMTDPIIKPFDEFGNGVSVSMINSLNDSLKEAMGSNVENHLRSKGLTLPSNLIVIGTVNMDETTFSFSRKVLDRAMSIEMNEVNYDSFLEDTTDDELKAIVEEFGEELNELLVNRHIHAKEIVAVLDNANDVIKYLETINNLLEGTPFKLGYRAANEALIYLKSSKDFGLNNFTQAMDNFTLMKILSRIEGDESKLRITESNADNERLANAGLNMSELGDNPTILQALRVIIVNQLSESPTTEDSEETKTVELKSIKKIDQMISQLNRDHFVSYWN